MGDRYLNFAQLAANAQAGRDYAVFAVARPSPIAIIAPHGGGIERGTSELATAIASEDHSLYLFEGLRAEGNDDLHITSTRFDEPRCLDVVAGSQTVVTIHGVSDTEPIVHLGGLDLTLIDRLARELERVGFTAVATNNAQIAGKLRHNICNRGASGRGCQLEISDSIRCAMFRGLDHAGRRHPTPLFYKFVGAVRAALDSKEISS